MSSRGSDTERDEDPQPGWVALEVSEEFPELSLLTTEVGARPARRSPRALKERLHQLSNRFHGAQAINLRQHPIPAAYRIFYRHIGLDPDLQRTPIEQAVLERMLRGGFRSRNLVDDALLIGLVETGVPVWALDADTLEGPLGIRLTQAGELLGRSADALPMAEGRLVVADAAAPLAELFGAIASGHGVNPETRRLALFAVQVAGVPAIHVEEALWTCRSALHDR